MMKFGGKVVMVPFYSKNILKNDGFIKIGKLNIEEYNAAMDILKTLFLIRFTYLNILFLEISATSLVFREIVLFDLFNAYVFIVKLFSSNDFVQPEKIPNIR